MNKLKIILPATPFPSLPLIRQILTAQELVISAQEGFRKMSYHNRYYIATAQGLQMLSLPIAQGRNQKKPMSEVLLFKEEAWQQKHWRTLTAAYGRAPFFEHFGPLLQPFFEQPFERLIDFNTASLQWCLAQLNAHTPITVNPTLLPDPWVHDYKYEAPASSPTYTQLFEDRNGFLPHLSILDLLLMEGPNARFLVQEKA